MAEGAAWEQLNIDSKLIFYNENNEPAQKIISVFFVENITEQFH